MKTLLVLITLAVLAGPAMAIDTDLPAAIETMKAAIEARLAQIGDPADKALKKEASLLNKALTALEKFVAVDKKGLKTTAKATKLTEKAGSSEQAITDSIEGLIDCLKQLSDAAVESAETQIGDLQSDKTIGKMTNLVNKWKTLAENITLNYSAAAKALTKAILGLDKAEGKIVKALGKQGGGGGFLTVTDGKIVVPEGETLLITNICYTFKVKVAGQSQTIKGDVKDDGGTQFPIEWPGGGLPFDGSTFLPASLPINIPGVSIKGDFTYKTNFGDYKVDLNIN